jgi:GAF domain-containing protein
MSTSQIQWRLKGALETLQPAVRNTANPEEFPPDLYELMVAEGLKTQCVIPLVSRGRAVGILAINRSTDDPFLPDEIDFLKDASGQVAIAIENCLAFSEISELKEKLAQREVISRRRNPWRHGLRADGGEQSSAQACSTTRRICRAHRFNRSTAR